MNGYKNVEQYFLIDTAKVVSYEELRDYYLSTGYYEEDCTLYEDCRCGYGSIDSEFSENYHFLEWLDGGSPDYFIDVSYTVPEVWARKDENSIVEVADYTEITAVEGSTIKIPVFIEKMEEEKED